MGPLESNITGTLFLRIASRLLLLALVGSLLVLPVASQQEQEKKKEPEATVPASLPKGKRLVLKDGNYQVVRSYERKGDRVRYFSVERSAWEEIPAALVDWEATRRAETEDAQRREEIVERMRDIEIAERAAGIDVDASIEIAPGVFLPDNEGLYVIEGRAALPLTQVMSDIKLDKAQLLKQILVPIPVIPTRHRVLIQGKQAVLRITTSSPEFYFRTADEREPEFELIRAKVKGDAREIEVLNTHITGDQIADRKSISVERWKVSRRVWRFTMSQSLEPGEYVLAEVLPGEGLNLYVWDFGVDGPDTKK